MCYADMFVEVAYRGVPVTNNMLVFLCTDKVMCLSSAVAPNKRKKTPRWCHVRGPYVTALCSEPYWMDWYLDSSI